MLFTLQQLFEGYASDTFWHAFLRTPTAGYPNGELVFHGIENIHVMRDSLAALLKVVKGADSMHSFLAELDSCKWLTHIRAVLETTSHIVRYVLDGRPVVIHCSDGWDRTAQTCSLAGKTAHNPHIFIVAIISYFPPYMNPSVNIAMRRTGSWSRATLVFSATVFSPCTMIGAAAGFMLEPYYRTIRGFIVLVEKEWLGFGHKMSDRNQFIAGKDREVSPIFLQFLECTWQLSQQYPRAFEFNELFLVSSTKAAHAMHACSFLGVANYNALALPRRCPLILLP